MDGVLASFERGFVPLFPFPMPIDDPDFPPVWHYPKHYGATGAQVDAAWDHIKTSKEFWFQLPDLQARTERDIWSLNELRWKGHDIYFITARIGVDAKRQTEEWLMERGFRHPTVLMAQDKGLASLLLKLDAYIDDKPSNIESVIDVGQCKRVYVMDRPYNRTPLVGAIRVATIGEMIANEQQHG